WSGCFRDVVLSAVILTDVTRRALTRADAARPDAARADAARAGSLRAAPAAAISAIANPAAGRGLSLYLAEWRGDLQRQAGPGREIVQAGAAGQLGRQ